MSSMKAEAKKFWVEIQIKV